MILVPGRLWRQSPVCRALGTGLPAGVFFAAFVLVESGSWPGAAVVFLVLSPLHGIRSARRMGRAWPGAADLDAAGRAAVVRATRRGEAVGDPALAPAVVEYADGLHRIAEEDRLRRPLVLLVTVLAVALAGYDTVTAPTGVLITSWLVAALLLADLAWWPRRRARLLERAARARQPARSAPDADRPGSG
ncbi:hypothetical protein [Streptomyces sp. NBC_00557]|uniref:hypothetical protein n=1 Tax=Streptomyces sp. NBC_00557 TaxID=2975776 RepID=UPI002E8013A3|nr:hypothetical protein [Streptomyces sp. NBC_00557]WUC33110.1 hypothetical protein OG956_02225 [Streptomyces sp. NBC_00557]